MLAQVNIYLLEKDIRKTKSGPEKNLRAINFIVPGAQMSLEICGLFWRLWANEVGPSPGHICHHKACWQQEQLNLIHQWPGGGHSHWKVVQGCAAVMTPIFQANRRSLAFQFTINTPLMCHPFWFFRKILHFQPCFGQKFQLSKCKFVQIFVPKTPHFSRKICSLDPTFGNLCGTHPPKKKLSAPPGQWHVCFGT